MLNHMQRIHLKESSAYLKEKSERIYSRQTQVVAIDSSSIFKSIIFKASILFLFALFSILLSLISVRGAHAQSCPLPAAPTNVLVEYPGCSGDNCSLAQASCSWGAVAGATSYSVKITEVDTTTIIKSETVTSNNTYLFPVTQNRVYRCEVAAINSCGTGPAGQHELLCKVEGLTEQKSCGQPCTNQSECIAGTTCIQTSTGGSVCAVSGSQTACQASPGIATCCSAAPVGGGQAPTVGTTENLLMIAGVSSFLIFFGSMFFLKNRG